MQRNRSDTNNNGGKLNHFKITQIIFQQHTGKTRNYGTTKKKTAILGTAHKLREVLMEMFITLNMGSNVTFTINCNYRTAATKYTLEI